MQNRYVQIRHFLTLAKSVNPDQTPQNECNIWLGLSLCALSTGIFVKLTTNKTSLTRLIFKMDLWPFIIQHCQSVVHSWLESYLSQNHFFFFLFGFYDPFKNISLILSQSFIKGGWKLENLEKTIWPSVSRTWLFHMWPERGLNHSGEKPNGLRVSSLIHQAAGARLL